MVFFNYSTMQMAAKVVYYGPGLCGKTTNLQWIFEHTSKDSRGEMVSLATETDRTLFFDLLPIDVGTIAGFNTRIQLYTVPGQVFYNTTRKLVLKGVDGVVFVADSQAPMLQANIDSLANLEENLNEMGLTLEQIPVVLQYNKQDLPNVLADAELDQALKRRDDWPTIGASAIKGEGVFETLKLVSKATLMALKKRLTKGRAEGSTAPRPAGPPVRPPLPKAPLKAPPRPGAPPRPAVPPPPVSGGPGGKPPLPRIAPPPVAPPPAVSSPPVAPEVASPQVAVQASVAQDSIVQDTTVQDTTVQGTADRDVVPPTLDAPEVGEIAAPPPVAPPQVTTAAADSGGATVEDERPAEPALVEPEPLAVSVTADAVPSSEELEPVAVEPAAAMPTLTELPAPELPAPELSEATAAPTSEPAVARSPEPEPAPEPPATLPLAAEPEPAEPGPAPAPEPLPRAPLPKPPPGLERPVGAAPPVAVARPAAVTSSAAPTPSAAPSTTDDGASPARRKKSRLGGMDALAELEKLRRQALRPRNKSTAVSPTEVIRREATFTLPRAELRKARGMTLALRLESQDHERLGESREIRLDVESPADQEELRLALKILLRAEAD